jgi:TPR repeat protein
MVNPKILALGLTLGFTMLSGRAAHAQIEQQTPAENVRERALLERLAQDPYWDGFALKAQGNCTDAVTFLRPLAERGLGYEDAQVALAECLLETAGIDDIHASANRQEAVQIGDVQVFEAALSWIHKAANTGNFQAQGLLVLLYVSQASPNVSPIEAATWAHLYLTNPKRLTLGAPSQIEGPIETLKARLAVNDWLLGKERARKWVASFDKP